MSQLQRLVLGRIGNGAVTLAIVSALIFIGVELMPGDIAQEILGQSATPETVAALRLELGLDRPAYVRYFSWMVGVLHGDLGRSLANEREVAALLAPRIAKTLFLACYAAVIVVPVSLIFGVLAALFRGSLFDRALSVVALAAVSMPEFLVAYLLILLLAVRVPLFPSLAHIDDMATWGEVIYNTFLPAMTLFLIVFAHMMRMTRAAIIGVLASPYIEMARLKGIPPVRIVVGHALPNVLAPIINVVALNLAYLIVGVVVIEVVFTYPGLGRLLVDAVIKRDLPVVQAVGLFFAAIYIVLNLIADVLSILANPRLRRGC